MKKSISILLAVLLSFCVKAQAQVDTTQFAALDSLLSDYYYSLLGEAYEVKCGECDFLISSCKDSLTRQHVAINIFNHYCEAPVMGDEAVAVYIYDNWFGSGRIKMRNDWDDFQANMFAEFNRRSLLYMQAPDLELFSPEDEVVSLPVEGQLAVYFFYDTACSKCKAESLLLPSALTGYDFQIWFYAIYVGDDEESWAKFRSTFKIDNPDVEVVHLWDPEITSDYQRKYGVTQTPRMFVIEPEGSIIGRRLEIDSMKELLNIYNTYLGYGQQ